MTSPNFLGVFVLSLLYLGLTAGSLVRKNVDHLTEAEILKLQTVLRKFEEDTSDHGFHALAAYHGEPSQCAMKDGTVIACCIHGDPTFPQWHRAYTVQFEQLMVEHDLTGLGLPYWDWTKPLHDLPELVKHAIYKDADHGGLGKRNAWASADINHGNIHTSTARAVDDRLYQHVKPGENTRLFELVLDALEQTDYCHFEAQFEVAHNHIHYLVGGRHHYSMSTLEYASFDPIFFLHHSNVDRLFVIWQELQKRRGLPHDHSDCGVELFNKPMEPFKNDNNPVQLTKTFSKPKDLFNHQQLGYTYDDLSLNEMSLDQLHTLLEHRRSRDRHFAAFSLHGLGFSANVKVELCYVADDNIDEHELGHDESEDDCVESGDFYILGGANEMPWEFTVPYYFDVSEAFAELKHHHDADEFGHMEVRAHLQSVNGTQLDRSLLGHPYISHRPAAGYTDPVIHEHRTASTVVRKDIEVLTDEEVYALRQSMQRFMNDTSIDGFQMVAEYHGLPAKCPHPDAAVRYACCIHGSATFPHWHRLFVTEIEDELKSRGLQIGVPYWDWTRPNTHVPALASEETYEDPHSHKTVKNPFHHGDIAFLGATTTRQIQPELSETPAYGDHTALFDGMLLAFEQTDYCDFEVQFEVVHNAIHFLVGGYDPYTMATLHYSAFDPIFYLHHSNVDRLWAIWQALQMRRGLPYRAHCAGSLTTEIMRPFGFPPPFHNDPKTHDNARPYKIYDYEATLDYTYDSLQFGGMTVAQLDHYLEERKAHDRTFVGVMLHNIGVSAWVTASIEMTSGDKYTIGKFGVLGGEKEMPWRFDRVFKVEITDALKHLGLAYDDEYHIHLDIVDVTGKKHDEDTFLHEHIIHVPAQEMHDDSFRKADHVRNDVDTLTREQMQDIRDAMQRLKDDAEVTGFGQLASFHGQPNWCPSPDAAVKYACCAHGMAVFPHWHRLLTAQAEDALLAHGMHSGLPYWDWTLPMTQLPDLVKDATYTHPESGASTPNPWFNGNVNGHDTVRDVQQEIFAQPEFGHLTRLADKVMLAFEQDNFCDFEVQFEIAHNYIHVAVGGNHEYSMASLRYTAFDPLFYLHHSNTDRIWAIWQQLQKYRGKPYNTANCALAEMRKPQQPFAQTSSVNPDPVTRDHSVPFDVFDYHSSFHYEFDNFQFNGMSIPQLNRETIRRQGMERVFAGFMLHGIKESSLVKFELCKEDGTCTAAGRFYLLGDEYETPWEYDRLFKYDVTGVMKEMGLDHHDHFDIHYEVFNLAGTSLGSHVFGNATVIHMLGKGHMKGHREDYLKEVRASSHVRKNINSLTRGESESLRSALRDMEQDGSFDAIAQFHGSPGLCEVNGEKKACCVHGSPVFPHWHRLYVENVENSLLSHGSAVSVPYWDWIQPIVDLPELVRDPTYIDLRTQNKEINPFFRWKIPGTEEYTTRDMRPELYDTNYFLNQALLALEQTSFCDFEVQFEITHNALHYFVGGRGEYSMSTLDYTAFDPIFFLHHANVDRLWAIWQALQMMRGLPFDDTDCAMNLMHTPLHPFDDANMNDCEVTRKYSKPIDVFDYSHHFDYHYDTLEFNSWSIPQLEEVLKKQRSKDRIFAGFLLHDIGTSADVEIDICINTGAGSHSCNHPAGKFSILGGTYEMPFTFDRLFKYDISDAVRKLNLRLDSAADFDLEIKIHAYNGSYIDSSLLKKPTIIFQPGEGQVQDDQGHTHPPLVRKSVWSLSPAERRSLVLAMRSLEADHSGDGFQSIAAFHAQPPLCPYPEASKRYACCVHGMATFPQWHRLYTVQFEDALRRHGSLVGVPYWDTVSPQKSLPPFFNDQTWDDPLFHANFSNPWHGADIDFKGEHVARDVNMEALAKEGPHGYDTWSWKQYIYALEQEDYCDFEVQFEIAHNAIHMWMGGSQTHSMSHLHYASYDPVFYLHHSNTDRIFAIWQQLQTYRGHDPNEVNCALEMMREPLKPFSFGAPYNLNPTTHQYSKPEDAFDYQGHFHYQYDRLELQGMGVERLQDYINQQKEHDRVFAGFLLAGIGESAHVSFSVCTAGGSCTPAGFFDILGGDLEMPWRFDRLYKYEITDVLKQKHLDIDDMFDIKVTITATNGTALPSSLIQHPSVIHEPHSRDIDLHEVPPNRVRHELGHLTERDIQNLKSSLRDLQLDKSLDGYHNIARFHGYPALCPSQQAATHSCCIHGMPTFPHWHRLYTVEMEDALIRHGSGVALPYWDWLKPMTGLPSVFTEEDYYDFWRDEVIPNPFVRALIDEEHGYTVRDPQPEMLKLSRDGRHSVLFDEVLLVLEQTDYCDFEVQFEVLHNAIHFLVGGYNTFSMSTLEYTSYDPIFFVHHAMVDKIWAVWQEMQKKRGLNYDRADCAVNFMNQKMHPFDWANLNPDVRTREHAVPQTVFDYEDLGYHYDDFTLGGEDIESLEALIKRQKSHDRVFAGLHLHGIETSAAVVFHVCRDVDNCVRGGGVFVLGGPLEMPWSFDRLYKYDITDILHDIGIEPTDVFNPEAPFHLKYEIHGVNGSSLPLSSISEPTLIFVPAQKDDHDDDERLISGVGIRKNINSLSEDEMHDLQKALEKVKEGQGRLSFNDIASYHGYPTMCHQGEKDVACCHHGMASFPMWHRLFTRQLEVAMTWAGAHIGIPYWDWTEAFRQEDISHLLTDKTYDCDENGEHHSKPNPFHHSTIPGKNVDTSRDFRPQLFNDPEHKNTSFFYRQVMLAFEQRDYCDFEVQFEVIHNAIHSWTGGTTPYGMSSLEYSAYDPLFFIHHSNVDRQFAIWQALQRYRGLDYNTANCNVQELRQPLEPFNRDGNPVEETHDHATAIQAFDYDDLHYQYDNLNFHGMTIPELEHALDMRKAEDRVFLNFMLSGIQASADVTFDLCDAHAHCEFAGTFAILGGPTEMPWSFDRAFKYDVTSVFQKMHLRPDSDYHFHFHLTHVNGTKLDIHIDDPSVSFMPGIKHGVKLDKADDDHHEEAVDNREELVRSEVTELTLAEVGSLRYALTKLMADDGPNGFEAIASFHGAPGKCPEEGSQHHSCCQHGMTAFPHWHRLLTVQFERALKEKGSLIGIPYWDWTRPSKALPSLFTDAENNPFHSYHMRFNNKDIHREVSEELFLHPSEGDLESLFHQALEMLEETNYCDFEVQYEILHNAVHELVGGSHTYGMSTLEYSAFDPFFMVHHSSIDRLWQIWQGLQKLRHKPFNYAACARRNMYRHLEPFSYPSVNMDPLTRANSQPVQIFDSSKFHYHYDSMALNGHDLQELEDMIHEMQNHTRLFAGFVLSGFHTSARIHVDIVHNGENINVGNFYVLGGPSEMPWAYERIYKIDMTDAAKKAGLMDAKHFTFALTATKYNGTSLNVKFKDPVIVRREKGSDHDELIVCLTDKHNLPPKIVVRRGTHVIFHPVGDSFGSSVRELGSFTNSQHCAIPPGQAHSYAFDVPHKLEPGEYYFSANDKAACMAGGRLQLSVDVE